MSYRRITAAGRLSGVLAVAAVLSVLPFLMSDYHQTEWAYVGVYFIAIFSLNILTGYTGQVSLGHGGFMMIGGYTSAILAVHHGWNIITTIPIAALICFGTGIVIGIPALRLRGILLALATFALAVSMPQIGLKFAHFTGGISGILTGYRPGHWLYPLSWSCAAVVFVLGWLVLRGRTGRAFRAIRDSEVAAVSSGINLALYKTLAFGVSAAFAGVAGSVFVIASNYAEPNNFPVTLSINILVGAAIAGLGSLSGMLFGAIVLEFIPTWSQSAPLIGSKQAPNVIQGLLLIVIMLVLRGGFAGLLRRLGGFAARSGASLTDRIPDTS